MEITSAILIRKTKLTETSLIISWLTEDLGRVKTVAKGARSAKSQFAGTLDLFFHSEIHFSRSRKSDLHQLREAALAESFEALRFDYDPRCWLLISWNCWSWERSRSSRCRSSTICSCAGSATSDTTPASRRAMLHFEAELARLLGIQAPDLTPAVAIGRVWHKLPPGRRALLARLA